MDGCEKSPQPLAVVNQKRAIEIEFERGKSIPFFFLARMFLWPDRVDWRKFALLFFFVFG